MPRINIEESFWSDHRFLNLCVNLANPAHAIGACVMAWKEAQKHWLNDHSPIPIGCFQRMPYYEALEASGIAEMRDGGAYIVGTEQAFEWLIERREAGARGGRISAQRPRDAKGHLLPKESKQNPSKPEQTQASSSSSSSSSKKGTILSPDGDHTDYTSLFREYPKRGTGKSSGKTEGLERLKRLLVTDSVRNDFMKALRNYAAARKAVTDLDPSEAEFTMMFSTFVNKAWKDWVEVEPEPLSKAEENAKRGIF